MRANSIMSGLGNIRKTGAIGAVNCFQILYKRIRSSRIMRALRQAIRDITILRRVWVTLKTASNNPMGHMICIPQNLDLLAGKRLANELARQTYLEKEGLRVHSIQEFFIFVGVVKQGVLHIEEILPKKCAAPRLCVEI